MDRRNASNWWAGCVIQPEQESPESRTQEGAAEAQPMGAEGGEGATRRRRSGQDARRSDTRELDQQWIRQGPKKKKAAGEGLARAKVTLLAEVSPRFRVRARAEASACKV